MYYVKGNAVYVQDGDKFRNVKITAKDKVVEVRELESVTITNGTTVMKELNGAVPMTMDEIRRKFNLSEANPIEFAEAPVKAKKKK